VRWYIFIALTLLVWLQEGHLAWPGLELCTSYSSSCHHSPPPLSLASVKSRMQTFWYRLTQVHLENGRERENYHIVWTVTFAGHKQYCCVLMRTCIFMCTVPVAICVDGRYSEGVSSPHRHVKTRLYFTSESHIHSLLTVLCYGGLCSVSIILKCVHIEHI